jgi:hypothetical protein
MHGETYDEVRPPAAAASFITRTKQSWKKRRSVPGPTAKLCWRRCEMTERTVDSALGHELP